MSRRRQKAIQSLISDESLTKIKNVLNYLFFDQYQDMASFPRFEECLSLLVPNQDIDFQESFTDIIGEKHKYLTFRRMIRAFFRVQEGGRKVKESTKQLFNILFSGALKGDGDFIGEKKEGATKFHSQNSEGHKAISSLAVITDETKEKIKGMEIIYDEFFNNELYFKTDEDNFVGLEINLKADREVPEELKEKFPDINMRDGIISIVGTFTDHLTSLGFKCRSGKTSFVGKPEGDPFLFSEVGKELKYIRIEVLNGEINYFEPHFEEIERSNPHIDKTSDEITDDFLKYQKKENQKNQKTPKEEAKKTSSIADRFKNIQSAEIPKKEPPKEEPRKTNTIGDKIKNMGGNNTTTSSATKPSPAPGSFGSKLSQMSEMFKNKGMGRKASFFCHTLSGSNVMERKICSRRY